MSRKLVIFGAKQIAEVCAFYFDHDSDYEVVAFTVDGEFLEEGTFAGRPVVASDEIVRTHPPSQHEMFIALSYRQMNQLRTEKYHAAKAMGYRLAQYVSSKAITCCRRRRPTSCGVSGATARRRSPTSGRCSS